MSPALGGRCYDEGFAVYTGDIAAAIAQPYGAGRIAANRLDLVVTQPALGEIADKFATIITRNASGRGKP